uniref:Cysteine dioxygenase n=1 Tax=Oncorhynchus kisutch TaxID=8019 RepID=A0A8C7D744_ONCKI
MEKTEVMTPKSLDDLIKLLHKLFESDKINVEEVQQIMEAYDSNPQEWKKFAMFDPTRYTRNLVDEGNGKFNLILLCWGEGQGSSIHDHTDSHCFMKMLQGELKETLFEWPKNKTQDVGDMVQKSQRILKENQCAYINGKIQGSLVFPQHCVSDNIRRHLFIFFTHIICMYIFYKQPPTSEYLYFQVFDYLKTSCTCYILYKFLMDTV